MVICSNKEAAIVDVKVELRHHQWKEFEAIMEEVASTRTAKTELIRADLGPVTVLEESPVAESSSNGAAENAIRHVQAQFRTFKAQLEDKLQSKIEVTHPIWAWLVEWSAITINRYHMGKDSLTAQQRTTRKVTNKPIARFGEKVLYRVLDNKHNVEKHEARYREGVWIGLIPRTDEDLVMTSKGVVKATSIRLLSETSKWDVNAVKSGRGYP